MKEICYDEIHKTECRFIDLGLPSGTLWMDRDIGSTSEISPGHRYFWWRISPKPIDTASHFIPESEMPTIYQVEELLEGTHHIKGEGYTCLISKTDISQCIFLWDNCRYWLGDRRLIFDESGVYSTAEYRELNYIRGVKKREGF